MIMKSGNDEGNDKNKYSPEESSDFASKKQVRKSKKLRRKEQRSRVTNQNSSKNGHAATVRYIHHVNPKRLSYEVVSRSCQTDWSWLRDKKQNENEVIVSSESANLSDAKENLELGLYGGFGVFNRGLEYEKNHFINKETESSSQVQGEIAEAENIESEKEKIVKEDDNTNESSSFPEKINKKENVSVVVERQRPKSAISKTQLSKDDSDLSDFDSKSCSSLMNVKPIIPSIKTGPPEIIKYHRQKSATGEKMKAEKPAGLNLPLAAAPVPSGLFSGICQFCGKEIIENSSDDDVSSDQSYCCPEYEHFIQLNNDDEDDGEIEDELIDITPHTTNFPSTKVTRKIHREKTSERVRERELERQRAATQQANLFSFAKQMKTIQYSLASSKYIDEGWTVKPKSPVQEEPEQIEDVFQIDFNATLIQKCGKLQERYYESGKNFMTIYPDGTGCCFYPSGHVAISIISVEEGKFTYIVQKDSSFNPEENASDCGLLGVFEPNGVGICYYEKDGKLRLFINAHGGIELNRKGAKRKRWQWYFVKGHVHTPPFQPICFPLNKNISIRVVDQHNIALIFTTSKRTVRFNVAANLKAIKLDGFGRYEADVSESLLQMTRKKISSILTQWHSCLRLPNSTRFDKLFSSISPRKSKHLPPLDKEASVIVN